MQNQRFLKNGSNDIVCNPDMRVGEIRQLCRVGEEGQRLMRAVMALLHLSARAYCHMQSVKLARTMRVWRGTMRSVYPNSDEPKPKRESRTRGNSAKLRETGEARGFPNGDFPCTYCSRVWLDCSTCLNRWELSHGRTADGTLCR